MEDKIYKTLKAKFSAVIDEIIELKNNGRPILVGTTSVEISELLGRMLNMKKIPHHVSLGGDVSSISQWKSCLK